MIIFCILLHTRAKFILEDLTFVFWIIYSSAALVIYNVKFVFFHVLINGVKY